VCVYDLVASIVQGGIGCVIGNTFTNIYVYADDMILLAPSWAALQQLLDVLELNCTKLDIVCNTKETVCMMFKPRCREMIAADEFPSFHIGCQPLKYVDSFRYLGHIINNNLNGNDNVQREIKNLFTRCNMLIT